MKLYFKDFVTLAAMACSVVSITFVVEGDLHWAGLFVWFAYALDALDGPVARWTGRQNKIGAHLDKAGDLLAFSIAPAAMVYLGYQPLLGQAGAAVLACFPALFGSLRQARNYANPPKVTNLWVGLPRPYSCLGIAALIGSHLFHYPAVQTFGIAYIIAASVLGVSTLPYQGRHHGGLKGYQIILFGITLLSWMAGFVVAIMGYGLETFFDILFFWMTLYMLIAWPGFVNRDEVREFKGYIVEWKKGF